MLKVEERVPLMSLQSVSMTYYSIRIAEVDVLLPLYFSVVVQLKLLPENMRPVWARTWDRPKSSLTEFSATCM